MYSGSPLTMLRLVLARLKRGWVAVPAIAAAMLLGGCGSGSDAPATHSSANEAGTTAAGRRVARAHLMPALTPRRVADLPAPVQLPATVVLGGRLVLMGGLDQGTASLAQIVSAGRNGSEQIGELPYAVHDAAGAPLGGTAYLLGGGEPSYSNVLAVDSSGHATVAGHLPVGASDVAAGVISGTVYVVGGYTGTVPLDTIVAWSGSGTGRVVARLPHPVRYAAVTTFGRRLIIAGGTSGDQATRGIYSFDPANGRVGQLGLLPRPLTHAAAAALGDRVYVIGGRGAVQGSQTADILAIDPANGQVRRAGRLPAGLSDVGAGTVGDAIMVAGGRQSTGLLSRHVYMLTPRGGTA